jgi:SM-20-related protein
MVSIMRAGSRGTVVRSNHLRSPPSRVKRPGLDWAAHSNIFMIRDFLDPRACAGLMAEARSAPTTPAPVYVEGSTERVHETVRKAASLHPSDETISRIQDHLLKQKPALEDYFGRNLTDCERPQFLRYREGDFFVRHQDGNSEQLEFDHLRIRRISIVVFLNDGSAEPKAHTFGGGSLNFYQEGGDSPAESSVFSLSGEAGLLVAFTADTVHEVTPVTSGERFTIISWFR